MMKVVLALCVLFAVSQAAHQSNWYSGSVNATGTPQAAVAVDLTAATCTALTVVTGYRNFTVNVTSAGFYYFSALFEKDFVDTAQLQVYNGPFNPAAPCTNLLYARNGNGYVPHVDFIQYLTPGLYPVVVTGPNPLVLGLFAIHVDAATLNGATNELTSPWWRVPSTSSRTVCTDTSYPGPYTGFNFAQNGTDTVDILAFGWNDTVSGNWDFAAALYNATTPNLAFFGSGNVTTPASGCGTSNYVYGFSTDNSDLTFHVRNNYTYQAAAALGVTLTNGLNYSIVIGTYDTNVFTGRFGVFMRPTSLGQLGQTLNFVAPDVPGLGTTTVCTPDTEKYYGTNWFTAIYNAYILDNPTGFFDTAGCLYRGLNIGNSTAPPATCPGNTSHLAFIQCGDTGDGGPVANFLIPGVNYTWVQFRYGSSTGTAGANYLLYNYSGRLLGNAPVTTTGSATTEQASSSDASSVVVMLTLTIAAMFF